MSDLIMPQKYLIYTDGGCRYQRHDGKSTLIKSDKSAYAYLIVNAKTGKRVNGTKGYYGRTNNQMELQGVIAGLTRLVNYQKTPHKFHSYFIVVSDSRYVDFAFSKHWLNRWLKTGKLNHHKNAGQWLKLWKLTQYFSHLNFKWVKGHAHTKGNIFVDHLLNKTMDKMPDYKDSLEAQHD